MSIFLRPYDVKSRLIMETMHYVDCFWSKYICIMWAKIRFLVLQKIEEVNSRNDILQTFTCHYVWSNIIIFLIEEEELTHGNGVVGFLFWTMSVNMAIYLLLMLKEQNRKSTMTPCMEIIMDYNGA